MSEEINEQDVVNYLTNNELFFDKHESLLLKLKVKHYTGSKQTSSLIERKVKLLQQENQLLKSKLIAFMKTAHQNDKIFKRIKILIQTLSNCKTLKQLITSTLTNMKLLLDLDYVAFLLPETKLKIEHSHIRYFTPSEATIQSLFKKNNISFGPLSIDKQKRIFDESDEVPASYLLIPLIRNKQPLGALLVGSKNINRFSPNMDTTFLTFVQDILKEKIYTLHHDAQIHPINLETAHEPY